MSGVVLKNIRKSYGAVHVIHGVDLEVQKGEFIVFVGLSGCGKSTLLRMIAGLEEITGGEIIFKGKDLRKLSEPELQKVRGRKIAMIFQEPMTALNPVLTVGFQITEQIRAHDKNMSPKDMRARAIELLDLVGIPAPEFREATNGRVSRVLPTPGCGGPAFNEADCGCVPLASFEIEADSIAARRRSSRSMRSSISFSRSVSGELFDFSAVRDKSGASCSGRSTRAVRLAATSIRAYDS